MVKSHTWRFIDKMFVEIPRKPVAGHNNTQAAAKASQDLELSMARGTNLREL